MLKNKKGFTLIELLIVIVIIGILAGIVVGIVGNNAQLKARDTKRKADFHELQNALEQYYVDHNAYPLTAAGLTPLFTPAEGETTVYIKTNPADMNAESIKPGADHNYQYTSDGSSYTLQVLLEDPNASGPGVTGGNYTVSNKQ